MRYAIKGGEIKVSNSSIMTRSYANSSILKKSFLGSSWN